MSSLTGDHFAINSLHRKPIELDSLLAGVNYCSSTFGTVWDRNCPPANKGFIFKHDALPFFVCGDGAILSAFAYEDFKCDTLWDSEDSMYLYFDPKEDSLGLFSINSG